MFKYHFIQLGCPKNDVDSEYLMGILNQQSFVKTDHPAEANIILINTCGFIEMAQRESINTILKAAKWKKSLWVLGCLSQRFGQELMAEIPEIDVLLGVGIEQEFIQQLEKFKQLKLKKPVSFLKEPFSKGDYSAKYRVGQGHYRYLKIAEGCNNHCSYCAIPLIRGPFQSLDFDRLINEGHRLVEQGATELILIAQDITRYGMDLIPPKKLPQLVAKLADIPNLKWLRLMYAQPHGITSDLLDVIAEKENICKYLDLPIQHVNSKVLQSMNRWGGLAEYQKLLSLIRNTVEDIVLRTTVMVGFPTEGSNEFNELLSFIKWAEFERLGVFSYSAEQGTKSFQLADKVASKEKERRYYEILKTQQKISLTTNHKMLEKVIPVIVDEINHETVLGRSQGDAPDIDNVIYLENVDSEVEIGQIRKVKITLALEHELVGEIVNEPS